MRTGARGVDEQGCIFGRDLCCIDAPGGADQGARGPGKMLDCMPRARASPAAIPPGWGLSSVMDGNGAFVRLATKIGEQERELSEEANGPEEP